MSKTKSDYSTLLKDPRQRKRLEIFHRADFHCEFCDAGDKTLHAHHKRYIKGRLPWEYDDADYACLCESCHESVSITQGVLSGKHESPEVRDAFFRFMTTFAAVAKENNHGPKEIEIMLDFLTGCVQYLDFPSRWEFGLHDKGMDAMQGFLEAMFTNAYREAEKDAQ